MTIFVSIGFCFRKSLELSTMGILTKIRETFLRGFNVAKLKIGAIEATAILRVMNIRKTDFFYSPKIASK